MNKQIKASLIGIGTGTKVHLTSAIVDGDKTSIEPSNCGSISWTSGKNTGYGYTFSDAVEFDGDYPTWQETYKAQTLLAEELLASPFACSKCAKHAQRLLDAKVRA